MNMKIIISCFFVFFIGLAVGYAQQHSSPQPVGTNISAASNNKLLQDSLQNDKHNGTIYSKVNKDGIIEISKKEFDKIPAERQAVLQNDKNYKITEDK